MESTVPLSYYRISGPAQICFSGGRTSAYLLHQILLANGGLPDNCVVVFQNTGKELEATLEFIEQCSQRWNVPITWLEWDGFIPPGRSACYFRGVDFTTADRIGTPFSRLIDSLGYLPNPTQRICTANLKIKTGKAYMRSIGYDRWENYMGIRHDEQRRVVRMRAPGRDTSGGDPVMPLADAGVTKQIVGDFWRRMPFDLKLSNDNGTTPHGNCDLCFLKGRNQVLSLIRENPQRADWWVEQEQKISASGSAQGQCDRFRADRPGYAQMLDFALSHREMYDYNDIPLVDCMCGD